MAASLALIFVVLFLLISTRLYTNWRSLSKAPGPILAGCTDFWRAYQQYNGKLRHKLLELHSRHGPIVRYGVRSISISDPEAISVIYGSRDGFTIADSYKVVVGIKDGKEVPSLISSDDALHGAMRRSVANAFTAAAALDYEKAIDATIGELLEVMSRKNDLDLTSMLLWYSIDAAGRFSFSKPVGCLQAEEDVGGSIELIRERFKHWGRWSSLPQLERLVCRNPITIRRTQVASSIVALAVTKLKERASQPKNEAGNTDLLQKFLESSRDHPQTLDTAGIIGILMATISAAGDTTAAMTTIIIYSLLANPDSLKKLEDELSQADLPEIPEFSQVNRLPYLNAVIKENMRLYSLAPWPMERLVPSGGATIAGMFFPEGTSVGCFSQAVHQSVETFGEDASVYRPERWLTSNREQLRRMEAAHLGFSRGRRNCIGQHIAMLQMKKVIPALVMKFKMSLVDPEASLDADYSLAIPTLKPVYITSQPRC
ncbi:cytochrome P450 [Hypoxylon sp. FL0543]|nr:cytochrome P450 [Hypoxylon sp. FL0543]